MTTPPITRTRSGLLDMYQRLSKSEKKELRMLIGNPARSTLKAWLDWPERLRLSKLDVLLPFLQARFPHVTLKSLGDKR